MIYQDLEEGVHQQNPVWEDAAAVQQNWLKHTPPIITSISQCMCSTPVCPVKILLNGVPTLEEYFDTVAYLSASILQEWFSQEPFLTTSDRTRHSVLCSPRRWQPLCLLFQSTVSLPPASSALLLLTYQMMFKPPSTWLHRKHWTKHVIVSFTLLKVRIIRHHVTVYKWCFKATPNNTWRAKAPRQQTRQLVLETDPTCSKRAETSRCVFTSCYAPLSCAA